MDRETAKQIIKERISCTDYLEPSKGNLYCCPFCGSGHGEHGTGALKLYEDTNTWTCFACDQHGDVIDLYQQRHSVDYNEALRLMAEDLGIAITPYNLTREAENGRQGEANGQGNIIDPAGKQVPQNGENKPVSAPKNFSEYYTTCQKRLSDPAAAAYLQKRGISMATAEAYGLGFDPEADPASAPGALGEEYKPHPCPRLIIPCSDAHYIARRTDQEKSFAKVNPKDSTPAIFNSQVLNKAANNIFIVEGAIDALSVIEAGAPAIALNSTSNTDKLIDLMAAQRPEAVFILSLDNDESGKKAAEKIRHGLQQLNIAHITANISGGYKDPNEALTADRQAFIQAIEQAQRRTAKKPDNTGLYIDTLMQKEITQFKNDIKTGFPDLDAKADGLYSGLYCLAAISSLGKTTFALQLADQIAEAGNDVLFFSMEQSRLELVSKSIARKIAQLAPDKWITSTEIRKGAQAQVVQEAIKGYKADVADRISIVEGNFNCDISFIGDYIRHYIKRTGSRPVVFIDYLQILQPADSWRSAKDTVDTTITTLKRISREMDLTIIAISSVNRNNYLTPVDFESLKESGGIEFTCDVVWGLQLKCLNEEMFTTPANKDVIKKRERIKEAKKANPRQIELVCLKNRYGIANYSCYYDYYPIKDLFVERSEDERPNW